MACHVLRLGLTSLSNLVPFTNSVSSNSVRFLIPISLVAPFLCSALQQNSKESTQFLPSVSLPPVLCMHVLDLQGILLCLTFKYR